MREKKKEKVFKCCEVSRTCNSIASFEEYGPAYVKNRAGNCAERKPFRAKMQGRTLTLVAWAHWRRAVKDRLSCLHPAPPVDVQFCTGGGGGGGKCCTATAEVEGTAGCIGGMTAVTVQPS
ncbi:unnamed protein product [Leptidea sinapis]|uniref:Uncharacterized protein n=1 Tax=Leptidea sinapis TaxID=189913 RepID=A0A5E4QTR6_9NEOP|nr:unnamed protein product [Leptidea sinapis]